MQKKSGLWKFILASEVKPLTSHLAAKLKSYSSSEKTTEGRVYTNKIEKICAQNQRNSVSGNLKCKNFLGGGARPQTP